MTVGIAINSKLWGVVTKELKAPEDIAAIKQACEEAAELLKRIPDTFPTYTLHDETHCLNICDRMVDLLGPNVSQLTGMEAAFLILSAFYHDIGMVYTQGDKASLLKSHDFEEFRKSHRYADDNAEENSDQIPDDVAECFFRSIHPRRMEKAPDLVVGNIPIKEELAALCKSHGCGMQDLDYSKDYECLRKFPQETADLMFCAILLRLGDILDFDNTRSPEVLYEYLDLRKTDSEKHKKSREEFLKHKSGLGFMFPEERSAGYKIHYSTRLFFQSRSSGT